MDKAILVMLVATFLVVVGFSLGGCALETYLNSDGFVFSITKDQAL